MTAVRTGWALVLAAVTTAPALAQGLRTRPPIMHRHFVRPLPPAYPAWPNRPATFPVWPYAGGFGYFPFAPGVLYGPSYPYYTPRTSFGPVTPPPLQGAGVTPLNVGVPTSPELTAELTIEFPAPVELQVNGEALAGEGKVRTLQSPALRTGLTHTFAVKARWTKDGQTYEWERTVALGPGERSRIIVVGGFPVMDKE